MRHDPITFCEGTATAEEIFDHMMHGNDMREALLRRDVDIRAYAQKLATHAATFEAWQNGSLVGLVAAYLNDDAGRIGYVSNVSVVDDARGQGIAPVLLRMCLDKAIAGNFGTMMLEVSQRNREAIALYRKFGFQNSGANGDILSMRLPL